MFEILFSQRLIISMEKLILSSASGLIVAEQAIQISLNLFMNEEIFQDLFLLR